MDLNKKYTVAEVKSLLMRAFKAEQAVHNITDQFMPVTIVEWYESDVFKKKIALSKTVSGKMHEIIRPLFCLGTHFVKQGTIGLFIPGIGRLKKMHTIVNCLMVLYHELSHYHQSTRRNNIKTYEHCDFWSWKYEIEDFLKDYSPNHYDFYHDNYYTEIEANLEGVDKVIERCEKEGILSDNIKERFQIAKNRYLYDLNNYDFHSFLHQMHKIVTTNPNLDKEIMGDYFFMNCLYNSDKSFKTVDEILAMAAKIHIDETFLNYFFSSRDFLKIVDFSRLSLEHQQAIMRSLEQVHNFDLEKRNINNLYLNNGSISRLKWLKADLDISDRLSFLTRKIEELKKAIVFSDIKKNPSNLKGSR